MKTNEIELFSRKQNLTSDDSFHVINFYKKKGCDNISALSARMAESNRTSKIICKSCCEVRNDSLRLHTCLPTLDTFNLKYVEISTY